MAGNMFGAFAAVGALQGIGQGMVHERNYQEALDAQYQAQANKEQLDAKLKDSAEQDAERLKQKQADIKAGTDKMGTDLRAFYGTDGNGGQMGTSPLTAPAMPDNPDDAPIQTSTPTMGNPTAPVQQVNQQNLPPQVPATGGANEQVSPAVNQADPSLTPAPQAAPLPQGQQVASNTGQMNDAAPVQADNTPLPATPLPSEIGMNSPAAAIKQQADLQSAQNPVQAYVAKLPPSVQDYASSIAIRLGITDPQQLEALMVTYAKGYVGDTQKFETEVVKPQYESMQREQLKSGPMISRNDLSPDDEEHLKAMEGVGLLKKGVQQFKPLTASEESRMNGPNGLFEKALNSKVTAQQGIGTINSMVTGAGDLSYGPMAEGIAKLKNSFAQMTDQQASNAVTNWYMQNKETIQLANANIRSLPSGVRAGIGLANLEKDAAPSANMTKEAAAKLMIQYYSQYRLAANLADAVTSGPTDLIREGDRVKFAGKYLEQNPPTLSDGLTPNPRFQEFGEWRSNIGKGIQTTGPSTTDIRKDGVAAAGSNAGIKQETPEGDKFMQQIQTTLPQGWTVKKN